MVLPSELKELPYPNLLKKRSRMNVTEGLASLMISRVYDFFIISAGPLIKNKKTLLLLLRRGQRGEGF
jgi:hypothetical protein